MTAAQPASYVTVFRSSAAVRLPRNVQIEFREEQGESIITVRTRYTPLGDDPEVVPRELWVEVVGPGLGFEDALRKAFSTAAVITNVIAIAMNAGISELEPELCSTSRKTGWSTSFFRTVCRMKSGPLE